MNIQLAIIGYIFDLVLLLTKISVFSWKPFSINAKIIKLKQKFDLKSNLLKEICE